MSIIFSSSVCEIPPHLPGRTRPRTEGNTRVEVSEGRGSDKKSVHSCKRQGGSRVRINRSPEKETDFVRIG